MSKDNDEGGWRERETCSQSKLTVTFHSPISVHVVCMCVSKCVCVHVSAHAVEAWGWYWMSSSITLYRICWGPVSHLNLDFTNMVNLACPLFLGIPCHCLENLTYRRGWPYIPGSWESPSYMRTRILSSESSPPSWLCLFNWQSKIRDQYNEWQPKQAPDCHNGVLSIYYDRWKGVNSFV